MRKLFVTTLVTLTAGVAHAQFTQGDPCGEIDGEGLCDPDAPSHAVFCGQNNTLVVIPCEDLSQGQATDFPVGTCEVYPNFGSWCAFNDGDACLFQGQNGLIGFACVNDNSGCRDGTCTANLGACTPDDPNGAPSQQCLNGTDLQLGCEAWAQRQIFTCASIAASSSCSGTQCVNAASGESCQDGAVSCATGLNCAPSGQNGNTCQTPSNGGEGEGEGEGQAECSDDGDCPSGQSCNRGRCEADEDPPACSDAGAATGVPLAGLLVLVGLAPIARRRRR